MAGQSIPQVREVGRVVLQVGVEDRHVVEPRRAEAGGRRGRLPDVARQRDRPQLGGDEHQLAQDGGRPVGRAVVDDHDLEVVEGRAIDLAADLGPERFQNLADELRQAIRLVLGGHDDRERGPAAPGVRAARG